jgi:hypothetical protein
MSQLIGIADTRNARRKSVLLRLDPKLYNALAQWAGEEFRSTNAQIEYLLHKVLVDAGRVNAAHTRRTQPRAQRA